MISVEKLSFFLFEQLLLPLTIHDWGFSPSFSTQIDDFFPLHDPDKSGTTCGRCIWWYEEPINYHDLDQVRYIGEYHPDKLAPYAPAEYAVTPNCPLHTGLYDIDFHIFANSEISDAKRKYLKEWDIQDWYFFFHGFAALDWFKDFKYLNYSQYFYQPNKVFICLNHLITNNRSYRLYLLSQIKQRQLSRFGHTSAPNLTRDTIKKELADSSSRLPIGAKKHILNNLMHDAQPLILDKVDYNSASADLCESRFGHTALWHVVTETVFYDESLHLTEKIFKPIVSKRPFILVGAPGNLAYLKRYGFRTFDRWIDESYDEETDPEIRINMIADQLAYLCTQDVTQMYNEMQEVLEYNHQHFYGKFREIIVDELLWNFKKQVNWYNHDRIERYRLPIDRINFEQVRRLILS